MKKLQLIAIAILAIAIIFTMFSCAGSKTGAEYSAWLQKNNNFEQAMKDNKGFTIENYREDLKDLKKSIKDDRKNQSEKDKIAKILAEIEELKAKN